MTRPLARIVALVLLVAACSTGNVGSPQAATVEGNGTQVVVELASCNADISYDVEESDTEVRVRFDVRNDTSDDCADAATVALDERFGNRRLVDDRTGEEIPVARYPAAVVLRGARVHGRSLVLDLATCGFGLDAEVEEHENAVFLVVSVTDARPDPCPVPPTVQLREPLRDRPVFDGASGDEVEVVPL
jgi:hypothetical protein